MLTLLVATLVVTTISMALIGLMSTDLTHASLQHAVARSFYLAQAGLEEAKVRIAAAPDPSVFTTPVAGVTVAYGDGHFTYWVDAGPAESGCGPGLKTLEAQGEVSVLGWNLGSRVRACGIAGTPVLAALFGVGPVQFQGPSRVFFAPYHVGSPGGGGSLGSFTEINFADQRVRFNALSEDHDETLQLRDGTFFDYELYGFPGRPDYNPNREVDAAPWVLAVFGDLIKGQPSIGPLSNRCWTPYACLTAGNTLLMDVNSLADLRTRDYMLHVYVNDIREQTFPVLGLAPETFQALAAQNTANAALNRIVGLGSKVDSLYDRMQFYRLLFYLVGHPTQFLRGPVYVRGSIQLLRSMNLGGEAGNVTLAVEGDLIVDKGFTLKNRHDLSNVAGRRLPGIVVFSSPAVLESPTEVCGHERVNGSGRLVVCEESTLTVDGLIYTQDGMAVKSRASVDQIGAMYHGTRGFSNASFSTNDATIVLRFDPLALTPFGTGIAIVSWQQLR